MASKAVGLLTFNFGANMKGFEKAMNKAEKKLKKFGSNLKKTGKSMTMGLTLPIVAMGVASVKAFDTQAKAQAKLTTALGGSETAMKSLVSQAKELQKTTLFGDEETIEAQSMLAMMGLQEDAILKLTPLIQDMATAKGMDLVTASDLVAKSLGSSTNALSRYGITITGAVGSNERLNTAVTELTTKFAGQAKVAATAGAGGVTQLTNQLGDLGEEIGMRLMPYVKDFVSWAQKMINKFDGLSAETKDSIVKWALYVAAIGPALMMFGKIVTGVGAVIKIVRTLSAVLAANPYAAVIAVVVALTLAMKNLRDSYITTVSAAESLQRVESVASRNIAEDISNIELLTGIIEDETTALEDKQSALETLKSTYPGYYAEIDNTFTSTKALTEETTRLKGEMMDIAMFEAAKEMIVDVAKEIIDLQAEMKAGQGLYWHEEMFWKTASGDQWRKEGRKQDNAELKRLKNHLENVTKLYKDLGNQLGFDITGGLSEPSAIVSGGAVGGDTGGDGGTDDAEKLLQDSLDRTLELEQEYSLLRTGIHLDEMGRKHAQSIAALEMERDNMLSNVEETENAEKEKDAIRELYNQKISDQLDANNKDLGSSQEDQRSEWDETFEHIEKGYKQVASVINQVFAGIGKAVSAVQDKQQAEFDNWKANEDKKLEQLDLKKEKEMEQLTESNEFKVMSQQEQDAALIGLEEKFADQSDAIKGKVARKEKALKLKQAKTNKKMKIFDAIIGTAAAVVTALGAGPILGFVLAGIVAALGAVQIAAIASTPLPAMAEGGLVTGPTTALVGEGIGTTMSNPEVIAPLDKLKGMMGNQTVEVFGKISGTDIVLSSNQTNINRLRSI